MDKAKDFISDKKLQACLQSFVENYGTSGLEQAMQYYTDMQQSYICKSKNAMFKIKISSIYYMQIRRHTITIYTDCGIYQKYGSLNHELDFLSRYHFVRCSQSCLVSLEKVRAINGSDITLSNGVTLHMSRNCILNVLTAFSNLPP